MKDSTKVNETQVTKIYREGDVWEVHGGVVVIDAFGCHFGPACKQVACESLTSIYGLLGSSKHL
jgi:hypothetical protein